MLEPSRHCAGKRDGRGVYMYAGGDVYEGEYKQGRMEGRGMYRLADGSAEVGRYKAGNDIGEGARWTPDRMHAWRLRSGKVVEEIALDEAALIAHSLGLRVPEPVGAEGGGGDLPAAPAVDASQLGEQFGGLGLSDAAVEVR